MEPAERSACPCGSRLRYANCCGLWHAGEQQLQAPDAERLMRSRYSAYVLGRQDYLLATWHSGTRPAHLDPLDPAVRWLGLEVRRHVENGRDQAQVEFVARSKVGGQARRLHELSRFVRDAGRWYYVDGELLGRPR